MNGPFISKNAIKGPYMPLFGGLGYFEGAGETGADGAGAAGADGAI
jgi:hypothetical protein